MVDQGEAKLMASLLLPLMERGREGSLWLPSPLPLPKGGTTKGYHLVKPSLGGEIPGFPAISPGGVFGGYLVPLKFLPHPPRMFEERIEDSLFSPKGRSNDGIMIPSFLPQGVKGME